MAIRPATASDLDGLTSVLIEASPSDPVYGYRFPKRHLYPEDFAVQCRLKCAEYLASSTVVVFESPTLADPEKTKIVAFSVWDSEFPLTPGFLQLQQKQLALEAHSQPAHIDHGIPPRRDANPTRMNAFRDACADAKTSFFDSRYTDGHMFLKILMCHPDYRRRGAGRALTSWGMRQARLQGLRTTLFSSPMGYPLYKRLGFREIGRFRVQLAGDEAFLDIPALVYEPRHLTGDEAFLTIPALVLGSRQRMVPPMIEVA